jgi:hypothetical protein
MEKQEIELAAALANAADGRVTIDLPTIWHCFYSVRPELKSDVNGRQRLAAALRILAEFEVISLPASKSSFDRTSLPALPRFVRLPDNSTAAEAKFDHRTFPWSLPMSFIAGLSRLPNAKMVHRLNDFFRGDWKLRVLVPVKERSYEIFGNEKALERVLDGQLGYEGRLTLETLRCYRVPLVPVHRVFPDGGDILILENEAAFDSVARWNANHHSFRMIIYGRGREVEKIADFLLAEIQSKQGSIYYYGDLDRLGVVIPYRLSRNLELKGGPAISPAGACYRLLLRQSPATLTMIDMDEDPDDPPEAEWVAALGWLPADLRAQAEGLLAADRRIAQEATGWELLRDEARLI